MNPRARDLSRASFAIPKIYWDVIWNGERFPGAPGVAGVEGGANCQQYVYSILRHFGFEAPDLRSSEFWADQDYSAVSNEMKPFDLVLVNAGPDSYGAHFGLCVGDGLVLHLSAAVGLPVIEALDQIHSRPQHSHLIGFKRLLKRAAPPA